MIRTRLAVFAALSVLSFSALAHKAWILPSQTVVSGTTPTVTFDAAVSNDLFYFNHVPLRLDNLNITAPDGSTLQAANAATGKYRSVFDLELKQQGTYRVGVLNSGLSASWDENGTAKRWRGNAASFAKEVPANAKDLKVMQSVGRIETFVTNGAPTTTALKLRGEGIELVPVTHPNDLVAGEDATFKLYIDGKPAKGLEVEIIQGGTRYRNAQNEMKVTTDATGAFTAHWQDAGMYWLETTSQDKKTSVPQAKERRLSYVATLEVLPQ